MKTSELLKKLNDQISKLFDLKFTGSVILRIQFNQGGIRDVKLLEERTKPL